MKPIRRLSSTLLLPVLALALLAAPAAGAISPRLPAVTIPPPTGPYRVGTSVTALTDSSRREPLAHTSRPRSIVVGLWYPTGRRRGRTAPYLTPAVAGQIAQGIPGAYRALLRARTHAFLDAPALPRPSGRPVLVFSPGYGIERQLYTGLVEDLASHGFVVLAIDHPEDANVVTFPDGRVVRRAPVRETTATIKRALAVRVADVRFLLDQLEARPRIARFGPSRADLDLSRIGIFGHSLGGATAANVMLADPRVVAGADLDGTIYGAAEGAGLDRPFMLMAGAPGPLREAGLRRFYDRLRGPRLAVAFPRARHFAFSDLLFLLPQLIGGDPELEAAAAGLVGREPPAPTLARERRCLTAFFDRFLKRPRGGRGTGADAKIGAWTGPASASPSIHG